MNIRDWLIVAAVALGLQRPTTITKGDGGDHKPPPPSGPPLSVSLRQVATGVFVTLRNSSPDDLNAVVYAVVYNSQNQVIDNQNGSVSITARATTSTSFDFGSLASGQYRVNSFALVNGVVASNSAWTGLTITGGAQGPGNGGPPPPTDYPIISQALIRSKGFGVPPIGSLYDVDSITSPILGIPAGRYRVGP